MVMELSIVEHKEDRLDSKYSYYSYTVRANDRRILVVVTSCDHTLSKWLNDVLKSSSHKKNDSSTILLGLSAEHRSTNFTKRGATDHAYQLLTLCVGSQCLIYDIDGPVDLRYMRPLRDFLENPRVVAVGMEIETVAAKLDRHFGIKVKNAVDLRRMAVEGLKEEGEQLDLLRYDLDAVAKAVLGKHVDVVRPEEETKWYLSEGYNYYWYCYSSELTLEKVQFSTIDAYLCYLAGSELHEMIHAASSNEGSRKSKKNVTKEKTTKKKVVNEKESN